MPSDCAPVVVVPCQAPLPWERVVAAWSQYMIHYMGHHDVHVTHVRPHHSTLQHQVHV